MVQQMLKINSDKQVLLDKITAYINKQASGSQQKLLSAFIQQYYNNVSYDDLCQRSVMDLAGAALSHWNFIYQRAPGEVKLRIYNPNYEQDNWQSTHTIIEIAHDDMPFLVDTVRMEITRGNMGIHLVINTGGIKLKRDAQHAITELLSWDRTCDCTTEALIHVEITRITNEQSLTELYQAIESALYDVRCAVNDWRPMLTKMQEAIDDFQQNPPLLPTEEINETTAFLEWLMADHFTFLGYRDYELVGESHNQALRLDNASGLGLLRDTSHSQSYRSISDMPELLRDLVLSPQALIIAKTNTIATVHRLTYTDFISLKRFNTNGEMIGERRFIGLFTSMAYHSNPQRIPLLRHKVAKVMQLSGLMPKSHAGKALLNILETFPRDDLFQASVEELSDICIGILNLQERDRVRLFVREDIYGRFISCFVFVPSERYDTALQQKFQAILEGAFNSDESTFTTLFSESILARIHIVVRVENIRSINYDIKTIEQKLINAARLWQDELRQLLLEFYGEERGTKFFTQYLNAFPIAYRERFEPRIAVTDIKHMEKLSADRKLAVHVYRPFQAADDTINLKIFQEKLTIPLSDVMPILENMGINVVNERPYEVMRVNNHCVWVNDFDMTIKNAKGSINLTLVKDIFIDAFTHIWKGKAENDGFNRLVLVAQLTWQECAILRALAKYLRQIAFNLSQSYIEDTFYRYPNITQQLVALFKQRFDPQLPDAARQQALKRQLESLEQSVEQVTSLDQDRIFRQYIALIMATLRTNYYQLDVAGKHKDYIAFKFAVDNIPDVPLPVPKFEIFVYSPRFEGVHLRAGNVARGGLRWSDRREDFRTEVLGLMKAQQVKNAVIVPAGAKGGFVPKKLPTEGNRNAILEEGVACYQDFIRSLLDLTDNLQKGEVVKPGNVICYDADDPYLVVAADKGTASFSDIANEISHDYGFWLGDAFASGGSHGYDHKKMGITARGAWESVKRHFRQMGVNTQTDDFTVVGIGDMAGDVFGNGMLLSQHIRLVAAFNHMHIFIDPEPDASSSYKERKRLFEMPRSSWSDYNTKLLSDGGGIFERRAKSIPLSAQIQHLLNTDKDRMAPNELIRELLCLPVDLVWNGGIGTYIKAETETDLDVGDKANDPLRINANQLRCKVIGEGGNLGLTQAGRVEFSLNGGAIYTDSVDNSAGVDCSDHEVNLKILLNGLVKKGKLSESQRNRLLVEMTDDIASLVLRNNYKQTQAIELAMTQVVNQSDLYRRYITVLEENHGLDRRLESLPEDKVLFERKANGIGLQQPELAVLFAYSKITLKQSLLQSDVMDDSYLSRSITSAFPSMIGERYCTLLKEHSLRREIIATQLSNCVINEMGAVFVYRLIDETGASPSDIVRAYMAARDIFDILFVWQGIEALDYQLDAKQQLKLTLMGTRIIRRSTRWLLRRYRNGIDIEKAIAYFSDAVIQFYRLIPDLLIGRRAELYQQTLTNCEQLPEPLARRIASAGAMYSALDIIDTAKAYDFPLERVTRYYFAIGNELNLAWLREQINAQKPENHWETLALSAFRDDLDAFQCVLAISVLKFTANDSDALTLDEKIKHWSERYNNLVQRWHNLAANIRASHNISLTILFVGLRELMDLVQASSIEERLS